MRALSSVLVRQILLLRGVNLGARNRISMSGLRELFAAAGFADVRTYLQSGNVVLSSEASPEQLAEESRARIADAFDLDVAVVVRTYDEIAAVVARNPLAAVATDPRRYQVSFLSAEPSPETVERLRELSLPAEAIVSHGRELYAWHPSGVARSKLSAELAAPRLGVAATARNWTTVTRLKTMAEA